MRANLLELLGADIGHLGELALAELLPGAARGRWTAVVAEAYLTHVHVEAGPPAGQPDVEPPLGKCVTAPLPTFWPIHRSWVVPAYCGDWSGVFLNPPKKLLHRDERAEVGRYLASVLLASLRLFFEAGDAGGIRGLEYLRPPELELGVRIGAMLRDADPSLVKAVLDTIHQVDLLYWEDGKIYHVEVKTTLKSLPERVEKKKMVLRSRDRVLRMVGMEPLMAVVVPRENWEIEVAIEPVRGPIGTQNAYLGTYNNAQ